MLYKQQTTPVRDEIQDESAGVLAIKSTKALYNLDMFYIF